MKLSLNKNRQSNIELLRILAMFAIVVHHFAVHSDFIFSPSSVTLNRLWIQLLAGGGKIGVNLFVLISGYFLITSKSFQISKLVKMWLQILTYSICFFLIFVGLKIVPFKMFDLIKVIFPITFAQWWFASTYFVLYLLYPYINKLLLSFEKKQYQFFLIFLTIIWCIIPTFTGESFQSNNLIWFIYLYAIAGYIKLYKMETKLNISRLVKMFLLFSFLTFSLTIAFDIIGTKIGIFSRYAIFLYGMQKIPTLLISVIILLLFLKIDLKSSKIINTISATTFGIYLIHENAYVRPFLWTHLFAKIAVPSNKMLIPSSIIIVIVVFIICALIEWIRKNTLEKSYNQFVDKISIFIKETMKKIFNFAIKY